MIWQRLLKVNCGIHSSLNDLTTNTYWKWTVEVAHLWMTWQHLLKVLCGICSPLNDLTTPTEGKLWKSLTIEYFDNASWKYIVELNDLITPTESKLWNPLTIEWFDNVYWKYTEFTHHWMFWQRLLKVNYGIHSPLDDLTTAAESKLWNSLTIG